jgi:hypothetical protein
MTSPVLNTYLTLQRDVSLGNLCPRGFKFTRKGSLSLLSNFSNERVTDFGFAKASGNVKPRLTRQIPTLRKDHTPKYSFPQYSTQRPKPTGQTMSLHNSWQTTAATAPTSIKGQRRPHHYVAAQKWKNKQLFTSWKTASKSPKSDLRRSKHSHAPK